jgi:Effector-associated domain 11
MEEIKNQIKDFIENNKIEEAIKLLKQESAKNGGQLDHIIISLSSRYKRYKKDSLMGLEARDQEFSKIVSDSLELVKALDDPSQIVATETKSYASNTAPSYSSPPASSSGGSNKYVQMGIGALAVIGLIALIIMFTGEDEPVDNNDQFGNFEEPAFDDAGGGFDNQSTGQETYFELYDVSGRWSQMGVSSGENCPDCTVDIAQSGSSVSVTSNSGLSAELAFLSDVGYFEGSLYWESNDPGQAVQIFFDEDGYLVMSTSIQGTEYAMYFAQ